MIDRGYLAFPLGHISQDLKVDFPGGILVSMTPDKPQPRRIGVFKE
jgi:hypothetical protein